MKEYKNNKNTLKNTIAIIFGIAIIVTMIAQLTFLSMFGTKGREVAQLRVEQKELILQNELLEAEISKMQSLDRVRKVASEDLGMESIDEVEIIEATSYIGSDIE